MLVEMALLCFRIITFRAGVLDPFMDRLDMLVEMGLLCCLILTFRARVLHSFMDRLNMSIETALQVMIQVLSSKRALAMQMFVCLGQSVCD